MEIAIQMSSGAVQGGLSARRPDRRRAFNTGMVLDGWCSPIATGAVEFQLWRAQMISRLVTWMRTAISHQRGLCQHGRDQDIYLSMRLGAMYRFGEHGWASLSGRRN